uniref:Sensor histidine kinase n=2 Tax=Strongyloides TaxID=6247 RepID=A0A0K0FJP6_STRVS
MKYLTEVQKIDLNDSHEVLFKLHWEERLSMYYSLFTIIFILLFVWIAFTYSQFSQEYYYYKLFKQWKRGQQVNI